MPNTSFVGGIRRTEPHILTVYGKHPFYLDPSQKGIWRRGTHFDEDEEQLQYLSFRQPFNADTILKPIYSWHDGNGGIAKNWKAQNSGPKLPDQGSEKQTNSVENKESSPAAGQANEIFVAEGGVSGNRAPESGVDVPGSAPVQEQSGSWILNTIASLSKGTAEPPRKKISLADYKARPRAGQQSRNVLDKSSSKQEFVMSGVDEGKVGKKRPIEDVVGSGTKDTTDMDTPYPDAKRARPSQKPGAIPNGDGKEPRAAMKAWAPPIINSTVSSKTTQGGAGARSHEEQKKFGEKKTEQRNFGIHQPPRKEKTSVTATEAAAKAVGSEHKASARKRPLGDVTGTETSTVEPAAKKRAIREGKRLAVDNQSISSEPKTLAPKKIQPNRSAPKNIGSVRPLPPLLSPILPDWVEEELTKQQAAGAGARAPRSNLAPLWTDQEFGENVRNTSVPIGQSRRAFSPEIHASKRIQRPPQAPENTGSARDLPPLLSPILPDWIEAEVTKRTIAGANNPTSTLAPLWTDQEFAKDDAADTSIAMKKRQRAIKQKDTAVDESVAQRKNNRSRISAAAKASKSNPYIEFLRRDRRFG